MLVSFGVMLVLTGTATGSLMIPVCTFAQNGSCYGAVGHTLYLQLPPEDQLTLKKNISGNNSTQIFKFKNQQITQKHSDPRWQFVNRTMIISSAEKTDSGRYSLDTFDSGGINKGRYYLQLVTEGVVSSVKVTYSCLSSEKRRVYCSSDGDHVQYNWTSSVDPQTVELVDGNLTLLLDKEAVGRVTCYAQNHVSREHKTIELPPCPGTTTVTPSTPPKPKVTEWTPSLNGTSLRVTHKELQTPTQNSISHPLTFQYMLLIMMGSCAVLLLMLSIVVFLIYRKKQAAKKKDSPEDGGELVYADVNHKPTSGANRTAQAQEDDVEYAAVKTRTSRKKKQQKEDEVQYGELVFNNDRTKQRNKQPVEQDECVYSQVQSKR